MANTVSLDVHKFVLVINGQALGYSSLSAVIHTIEEVFASEAYDKLFNRIATALSDDKAEDLAIYDIDTYADTFLDDEDEDE